MLKIIVPVVLLLCSVASGQTTAMLIRFVDGTTRRYEASQVKEISVPGLSTGVGEHVILARLAERFRLRPAYPNPCNPSAVIGFDIPADGVISMDIIDIRGAIVRHLFHGRLRAGAHSVTWDGRNDPGMQVASGIYFSRVAYDGSPLIGKIILIR